MIHTCAHTRIFPLFDIRAYHVLRRTAVYGIIFMVQSTRKGGENASHGTGQGGIADATRNRRTVPYFGRYDTSVYSPEEAGSNQVRETVPCFETGIREISRRTEQRVSVHRQRLKSESVAVSPLLAIGTCERASLVSATFVVHCTRFRMKSLEHCTRKILTM